MADEQDFSVEATPSLQQLIEYFVTLLSSPGVLERYAAAAQEAIQKGATVAKGAELQAATFLADLLGKFLSGVEEQIEPVMGPALTKLAGHLIGQDISVAELRTSAAHGGETAIGAAVAEMAFKALSPPAGELTPGDEGAKKMLGTFAQLVFNGWFEATAFEMLVTLFPDMDSFESIAELPHELVNALGLSRLARTGLRPLARIAIATPMEWKLNKNFTPTQLSESDAITAFNRRIIPEDELAETLARAGYSPQRQSTLRLLRAKYLSPDEALTLAWEGVLSRANVVEAFQNQGFDPETAEKALEAIEFKRIQAIRDNAVSTALRAYTDREITDSQLRQLLGAMVASDGEVDAYANTAAAQRELNVKHLSHGEVIDCVELGVLAIPDYRRWLEREGYAPNDADALELRLRVRLDKEAKADDERKRLAAERAKAQADAATARQKRLDELEAQRALHARGSIADLRRAVARGLIPLDRLADVLRAEYDDDTVQLLLELAEQDRVEYVTQQQRADDARKRAAQRNIDLGSLEQGVLHHILTVDAFGAAVAERGFTPADVQILTATLAAKLQDQDAATAKRARAEQDAKIKHIDLGRFERLVRRGIRTVPQYAALLGSLGYDEASIAGMVALLQVDIDDDTKARKLRDEARQKATVRDLSLEQFRRAVLLGVRTDQDFQAYLVRQHYTSEAQTVLVAELRRDVADAEAARHRRQTAEGATDTVDLSLSRITAAAWLGIISPDAYAARLDALGYTADDIAIEMELLLQEIADIQATRAKRDAADAAGAARGLSLSDVARAVKAGRASLNDYRARALELGYTMADAETLVGTLEAEQAALDDARRRRVTIDGELAARTLSLGQLDDAVKAGAITLDAYEQQLEAWGYGADDAQLLAALLADALAKKAVG